MNAMNSVGLAMRISGNLSSARLKSAMLLVDQRDLVRNSQADHNIAIAASKDLPALKAFVERLKANPDICEQDTTVFCTWVPAGVAVRPE